MGEGKIFPKPHGFAGNGAHERSRTFPGLLQIGGGRGNVLKSQRSGMVTWNEDRKRFKKWCTTVVPRDHPRGEHKRTPPKNLKDLPGDKDVGRHHRLGGLEHPRRVSRCVLHRLFLVCWCDQTRRALRRRRGVAENSRTRKMAGCPTATVRSTSSRCRLLPTTAPACDNLARSCFPKWRRTRAKARNREKFS